MLGFSCAGKSTYIRHLVTNDREFETASPVYEHMFRSGLRSALKSGDLFHMDISAVQDSRGDDRTGGLAGRVHDHPLFSRVFEAGHEITVDVLVAPRSEIRSRIERRDYLGLGWGMDNAVGTYPREYKLARLNYMDLTRRYLIWQDYLRRNSVSHRFLWSVDQSFRHLDCWDDAQRVLDN